MGRVYRNQLVCNDNDPLRNCCGQPAQDCTCQDDLTDNFDDDDGSFFAQPPLVLNHTAVAAQQRVGKRGLTFNAFGLPGSGYSPHSGDTSQSGGPSMAYSMDGQYDAGLGRVLTPGEMLDRILEEDDVTRTNRKRQGIPDSDGEPFGLPLPSTMAQIVANRQAEIEDDQHRQRSRRTLTNNRARRGSSSSAGVLDDGFGLGPTPTINWEQVRKEQGP